MGPALTRLASACESVQSASKPRHCNSSRMFIRRRIECSSSVSNSYFGHPNKTGGPLPARLSETDWEAGSPRLPLVAGQVCRAGTQPLQVGTRSTASHFLAKGSGTRRNASLPEPLLRFFLSRFVGGVKGVLERNEILARLEGVEGGLLSLKLLVGVVGGLDGEADAPVAAVNLDDARGNFLADLEDVLDLVYALLADLRDVDQAVNFMLQADKSA